MKTLLMLGLVALLLIACGSRDVAGGTTVETTNGITVGITPPDTLVSPPQGPFALRIAEYPSAERLCITGLGDTLSYAYLGSDVYVRVEALQNSAWSLRIFPDLTGQCPLPSGAAVFSATDGYVAITDLQGNHIDSTGGYRQLGILADSAQAFTLSAEVRLDSGLAGGEVLTIGNIVGFRMDNLGDKVAVYGYTSRPGVSQWHVLSGDQTWDGKSWLRVDLVVDAKNNRFELYFNGKLSAASTETIDTIAYDKGNMAMVLGRHAIENLYPFAGQVGYASISTVARSPEWIRWSVAQGRSGIGWKIISTETDP